MNDLIKQLMDEVNAQILTCRTMQDFSRLWSLLKMKKIIEEINRQ